MGIPVATLNTVAQILIPPPKYHVGRLVPGVRLGLSGIAGHLWIICRGENEDARHLSTSEAVDILLENCEDAYGFPPYDVLERLLLAGSDDDLRLREREIIRAGLEHVPAQLLSSAQLGWANDIHAQIVQLRDLRGPARSLA
jgi:hypothetical protein